MMSFLPSIESQKVILSFLAAVSECKPLLTQDQQLTLRQLAGVLTERPDGVAALVPVVLELPADVKGKYYEVYNSFPSTDSRSKGEPPTQTTSPEENRELENYMQFREILGSEDPVDAAVKFRLSGILLTLISELKRRLTPPMDNDSHPADA